MSKIMLGLAVLFASSLAYGAEVVEFYNSSLDNYFITAEPAEQAAVDNGAAGPGWIRTYYNFQSGGPSAVCRFYGSISPGPNSHFYTVNTSECNGLKSLQASTPPSQPRWNFESLDFATTAPVNGVCASGLVPVYRAYNNGPARGVDSNHRISSSLVAMQEVVNRGWTYEGVVMCSPPPACASPQIWNGTSCIYPMGVKVVGANQLPEGCFDPLALCWRAAVTSGLVKLIETLATQVGVNTDPIVFAYFRNTADAFGVHGMWNYTPCFAHDIAACAVIAGGTSDEVDWAVGTAKGVVVHSKQSNLCYELAWDVVQRFWNINGTGIGTPVPCPFN